MRKLYSVAAVYLMRGNLTYLSLRVVDQLWQNAGGKFDEGESALNCAQREVREETGLDLPIERFQSLGAARSVSDKGYRVFPFVVWLRDNEIPRQIEPHKAGPWRLFTADQMEAVPSCPHLVGFYRRIWRSKALPVPLRSPSPKPVMPPSVVIS